MKSKVSRMNSLVLILVAFSSLLSMFALSRIDNIVHQDLYRYNLEFSYEWAMPYWTMVTLVFAVGWFNIFITCAFQFYVLLFRQKEAAVMPRKETLKPETTYQPLIEEQKPQEMKPAEEPKEEPVMVEEEREEAETLIEAPQEEQGPIEEITPQEYIETKQHDEAEERKEPAVPLESVEPESKPQEETFPVVEEAETQETEPTEPTIVESIETEQEEPYVSPTEAQLMDEEGSEDIQMQVEESKEETQTSTEDTQHQETELTEPYPT